MTTHPVNVTRTIRLAVPAGRATVLAGIPGVAGATADGRRLRVSYDLNLLGFDDIIGLLSAAGLAPAGGLIERTKRRWIRFTERNLLDQSKIVHRCCSDPPER